MYFRSLNPGWASMLTTWIFWLSPVTPSGQALAQECFDKVLYPLASLEGSMHALVVKVLGYQA